MVKIKNSYNVCIYQDQQKLPQRGAAGLKLISLSEAACDAWVMDTTSAA